MVSRFRMKFDLFGQVVLIIALLLLAFFAESGKWPKTLLFVLGLWQVASAAHLYYAYKYIKKVNFLKTAMVLLISLPVWIKLIGQIAFLPVIGIVIWYFIQTIKDTIIVFRRPRSFWDI